MEEGCSRQRELFQAERTAYTTAQRWQKAFGAPQAIHSDSSMENEGKREEKYSSRRQ